VTDRGDTSGTPRVSMADELGFWGTSLGPFYDEVGAARAARLSPAQLERTVQAGDVLELRTSDGARLYPVFQFGPHGELLPHVGLVTAILRPICDDLWDAALWLRTPTHRFSGRSAADLLRDGDAVPVFAAARRDGRISTY
jgi:hypothetical protein